nr:DNA-directed DNA polymerase [Tanacetum cinerariifolium]
MPRECLAIIESKSKVCYSCDKPVVAKVSTNASTFGISPDVAELKDMVKALLLDKKSQTQSPALVKAVEESCVTYGGAHSYRNCPATDGNNYRDNIQEFVSQASAVNYNQRNTSYRPSMMSNQIRPPGFPPVPNNQKCLKEQSEPFHSKSKSGASTSSSGTLSSNKIANPKSDLKATTTRSEVTKDTVNPTNNGNTEDIQPQAVQSESPVLISKLVTFPISELAIAPVSMAECLALADLGASINLMPFSVWKRLSLPDLTPTCMTLELADHLISRPVGVAEDVYVKVGSFYFSADFVVVDFDADPRVPLILGRSFLKIERALIDMFEGELTLRVSKEAITFNMDQTSRYYANYNDMTAKRIDVIDMACEEYSQEDLVFSDTISSGNPTPYYDPIFSATSSTLTPFRNSDFLLEEVDAFLAIEDEPTSSEFHQSYLDPERDILLLEAFLNDDPSLLPSNQRNYLPEVTNLQLMNPRWLNSKFYLPTSNMHSWKVTTSYRPWVSPVHCVPKKGGFTIVEIEDNELIPTRLVTGWRVCIDYRKLNEATRKDYFPLPFMDQMLERLAGNQYYCFLDGFSGYFQILIDPKDQEKTTFICPPYYDSIVFGTSLNLTPFENSDFLLEEIDTFLAIEDELTSSEFHQSYLNPKGDILLLEAFLNDYPSLPPLNQRNNLPEVRKEFKICEAKSDKSSVDEPPAVELKVLPPHLEYAFLNGEHKLPVIIAKDLSVEEKTALITVLKSHKRAIAWKLFDIKGINPEFCTYKILIEEDFELLDAGLIYQTRGH